MENKDYHILLFYKFTEILNIEEFRQNIEDWCKSQKLLGRILISKEGINGSVSGSHEQTEAFKEHLKSYEQFKDISFKDELGHTHTFTKMRVIHKDTILAMGEEVDLSQKADYIEPNELIELYENTKGAIILDTRNDYEWKVGKFKNAQTLPIKTFREFPKKVLEILGDRKDKEIITYCTGGIRCEKATAFMKANGFTNVKQLHNGIINFYQQYPDTIWEGKCFVFDKRLITNADSENNSQIKNCEICENDCDLYRNCKYELCDRFVVLCQDCEVKTNGCCSEACLEKFKAHCLEKSKIKQGRRTLKN